MPKRTREELEAARDEILSRYRIVDPEPEEEFDGFAKVAAQVCATPVALVSIAAGERLWLKSRIGSDQEEVPLDSSFCRLALKQEEGMFVIEDTETDERVRDLPAVSGCAGFRFYAGAPLTTSDGLRFGMLCVLDKQPRALAPAQLESLATLADRIVAHLERRQTLSDLRERVKELRALHETTKLLREEGIAQDELLRRIVATVRAAFVAPEDVAVRLRCGESFAETPDFCEVGESIEFRFSCGGGFEGSLQAVALAPALGEKNPFLAEEREMIESIGEIVANHFSRRHAREELQSRERRYRLLFARNPQPMWVYDLETFAFLEVNEAALRHYGYSREEFLSMTLFDIRPEEDAAALREAIGRIEDGISFGGVWRHRLKDGRLANMEISSHTYTAEGRREGLVLAIDVTQRMEAERALRLSEEWLHVVSQATNDAIWDWNLADDALYWSEGYESLFGRSRREVDRTSKSWTGYIHPRDAPRVMEELQRHVESGGDHFETTFRFLHGDGHYVHVQGRGRVLRNEAGEAVRILGGMSDVSERVRSEERLREQAALLENASDAILVRDLEDRVVSWNKGAERIYGWSADEALCRPIVELLYKSTEAFDAANRIVRETGQWSGELEQINKAGERKTVVGRWTLVRDEEGAPKSIFVINTDITEQRQLERQFLRAQRLESIGTLAGGIAHDLNNMLTPIVMASDLLKAEETDPDRSDLLESIASSARRGADLVQQVLAFGRGVDGQRLDVDLSDLVEEVAKIARDTFPKNLSVQVRCAEDACRILGDSTQLHQVLLNLAVNARDAMRDGGQLIFEVENRILDETYAAMSPDAKPGPHVLVTVEDTGSGMPLSVVDRIFEPFFTTKELGEGTGLGLSTSLAIVKSHGGFLRVYSEPGRGTTFRLYFPAQSVRHHKDEEREDETGVLHRGNGETILVIDDEAVVRDITRQTLELYGYRVLTAVDGAEAVALYVAERDRIDLVLTDMMMPVMDGPATIKVLLKINPELRIIAASGMNSNGMTAKATGAGVKDFVPKPYTAEALLKAIHSTIHKF